eukprot:scaffold421_cov382-Prasinococcus_capsulatus_cf.AAC.15
MHAQALIKVVSAIAGTMGLLSSGEPLALNAAPAHARAFLCLVDTPAPRSLRTAMPGATLASARASNRTSCAASPPTSLYKASPKPRSANLDDAYAVYP